MINDRLYRGERTKAHTEVTVHDGPGDFAPLEGADAGFDWGRPTPGAQALAFALMREALAADDRRTVERFFHEVVLQLPFVEPWVLWRSDLQAWVADHPEAARAS